MSNALDRFNLDKLRRKRDTVLVQMRYIERLWLDADFETAMQDLGHLVLHHADIDLEVLQSARVGCTLLR